MANIRLHRKTGIYWYRRAVPAELRPHLPDVAGFPHRPTRTEFTLTLGTRSKAEANLKAAIIDQQVAAAFEVARKRVAGLAVPASNGVGTPHRAEIDPRAAFAALARWEAAQARDAERRIFNEPTRLLRTDADLARTKLVMALRARPFRHNKAWQRIDGFDERLAEALRSEGIPATADHPALERLRDDFAARWESILELEEKLRVGLWVPDTETSPPHQAAPSTAPATAGGADAEPRIGKPTSLRTLFDTYLADARASASMTARSASDARHAFRRFSEFVGEVDDARKVSVATVREFRDAATKLPSRSSRAEAQLPINDLIRVYEARPEAKRLTRKTISKWLDFLNAAFEHAVRGDLIGKNPVTGARFLKGKQPQAPTRVEFSDDDLKRIFAAPLFRGCRSGNSIHRPGREVLWGARYWVMLLGLATGARLNELGQLAVSDVVTDAETGIVAMRITADAPAPGFPPRKLKNAVSERTVPVHPRLLELGWLEYVEQRKRAGSVYLFPDLDHSGAHEPTKALSQWYGRFFHHVGVTDTRKVFHSFRHLMKTRLRKATVNRDISDAITGHKLEGVSGGYGSAPSVSETYAVLSSLRFACLDTLKRPPSPMLVPARKAAIQHREPGHAQRSAPARGRRRAAPNSGEGPLPPRADV